VAKRKIYVENDPTTLRIIPAFAQEIGINESIMLLQIDYLVSIANNRHIGIWNERRRANDWVYFSIRELKTQYFPFWNESTINRILQNIIKMDLIIEDNFNTAKYDRTRWIALNYGVLAALRTVRIEGYDTRENQNDTRLNQFDTGSNQNDTPIPETSPEKDDDDIKKNIEAEIKEFGEITGLIMSGKVQKELYRKWRENWGFSKQKIYEAGEKMCYKAKNPNLEYVDTMLHNKLHETAI